MHAEALPITRFVHEKHLNNIPILYLKTITLTNNYKARLGIFIHHINQQSVI